MKKLALAVAFIVTGTFAMAQQTQPTPQQKADWQAKRAEMQQMREQKGKEHLAELQKDLNLNQSQVAQIQALHDKFKAQRDAERQQNQDLRKQKMEGMQKNKQQMDDEMRKILTPDQYTKWQAKKQEKMQERKQKMMDNKGKFQGKGKWQGQPRPIENPQPVLK